MEQRQQQKQYVDSLLTWSTEFKQSLNREQANDQLLEDLAILENSLATLKTSSISNEDLQKSIENANEIYERYRTASIENSVERKEGSTSRVPIGGHKLPPLPYEYSALLPYIAEEIMRLHHSEHHKSYVDGLNKAEKEMEKARKTGDFDLIKHWEREAAFHGAGHYLHTIFWHVMSPKGGGIPKGPLATQINQDFGSFEKFKEHFSEAAKKVEGVGWAILVWAPRANRLEILQAEKHQNLSQWDVIPILPLDVWEHAYYLQYKNKRADYVQKWWNVVNWNYVNERFMKAESLKWEPFY